MRMVILGAAGQLGADFAAINRWVGTPWDITCLGRSDLDLSQLDAIAPKLDAMPFDVLVNCAAYNKVEEIETNAAQAFQVNAYPCAELAKVCRSRNARYVQISTDYVFDGWTDRPYRETDSVGPINIYGASKAMGEHLTLLHNPEALVVRVASLYGLHGVGGKGGNFVESIIRQARQMGEVNVVTDVAISTTWTVDAVKVISALLTARVPGGIYHVVNSGDTTWYEFAERIVRLAGLDARVQPITSDQYPSKVNRPRCSVLSNEMVSHLVGHLPHWSDALEQYLWERERAIRQGRRKEAS